MIQGYRILLFAGPIKTLFYILARSIVKKHLLKVQEEKRQKKKNALILDNDNNELNDIDELARASRQSQR